jgi:RNA polymerase sigma factor (sigma-70 family)
MAPCDCSAGREGDLCFGRNLSPSRRNEDSVRTDPPDAQLVAAGLGGDDEAFAALAERHRHRAGAIVLAMLGDPAEAEDVVQEALLRAYTDLRRLRDPDRFGGWLCGIAVNLAKMQLRRRNGLLSLEAFADRLDLRETLAASPERELERVELLLVVRRAVATLPAGQRDVLLMHYSDGLSCAEIGAHVGQSSGAVRVRLYRARRRLRAELAELAPRMRKETKIMIEFELYDVLVHAVPGEDAPLRLTNERLRIVVLGEKGGEQVLPIWIGAGEGDALAWHRGGEATPRPLTSDLMASLLEATGGRVESVTISSLREKTFYALVRVGVDGRSQDLDARPSDALNLAVRVGAPIFVDEGVLAEAGFRASDLPQRLDEEQEKLFGERPEKPGEWRSLSPELVRLMWEPPSRRK